MTSANALEKMHAAVRQAMDKLEGNGFKMRAETEYMSAALKTVEDESKARYVTVSLVISADGIAEGDEYCMSLGAEITRRGVDEIQLDGNIESYGKMVDEALGELSKYEDKTEGLRVLTAKASEEYARLLEKIEEEKRKSKRFVRITNVVFFLGIALLFILALLK